MMKLLTEVIPTALKRDCLPEGAPKDSLSFWVADMDFPCADPVIEALHQRIDRKIYGYTAYDNQDVYEAVSGWFMRQYGWKIEREELSFSPWSCSCACISDSGLNGAGRWNHHSAASILPIYN